MLQLGVHQASAQVRVDLERLSPPAPGLCFHRRTSTRRSHRFTVRPHTSSPWLSSTLIRCVAASLSHSIQSLVRFGTHRTSGAVDDRLHVLVLGCLHWQHRALFPNVRQCCHLLVRYALVTDPGTRAAVSSTQRLLWQENNNKNHENSLSPTHSTRALARTHADI